MKVGFWAPQMFAAWSFAVEEIFCKSASKTINAVVTHKGRNLYDVIPFLNNFTDKDYSKNQLFMPANLSTRRSNNQALLGQNPGRKVNFGNKFDCKTCHDEK